ncbi:hypothetical protein BKA83DRAFT_4125931 [Pisolithus microcarpus]|nr:hypothetical protein BKA83DRAFT_4125931 [Pisolithus microcarpus]
MSAFHLGHTVESLQNWLIKVELVREVGGEHKPQMLVSREVAENMCACTAFRCGKLLRFALAVLTRAREKTDYSGERGTTREWKEPAQMVWKTFGGIGLNAQGNIPAVDCDDAVGYPVN